MTARAVFPRSRRLLRRAEFRAVFDGGRSRSDSRIIVYARPRPEGGPTRLGLVVGRKYGGAIDRNRWKRRIRETFRQSHAKLPPAHDLIVLPVGRGPVPGAGEAASSLVSVAAGAAKSYRRRGPR